MTVDEYTASTTTSEIRRSGAGSHFQSIDAHYYNITDAEAWPVAGLLVLLDGKQQPVRAELHLYEDLPSHIQEAAVRQSRLVLQEHYSGGDPLPLRILQTEQLREAMDVRLPTVAHRSPEPVAMRWWPIGAGVAGITLLIALVWFVMSFFGAADAGEASAPASGEANSGQVAASGNEVAGSAVDSAVPFTPQDGQATFDLPPSRNARSDIGIGMRVQIVPGLKLSLRSEAGSDAGEVVGFMENGEEAMVIGGPAMTRGDSDTIVWWFVQLDNGAEAWAAANTSQQTLLIPAP